MGLDSQKVEVITIFEASNKTRILTSHELNSGSRPYDSISGLDTVLAALSDRVRAPTMH